MDTHVDTTYSDAVFIPTDRPFAYTTFHQDGVYSLGLVYPDDWVRVVNATGTALLSEYPETPRPSVCSAIFGVLNAGVSVILGREGVA